MATAATVQPRIVANGGPVTNDSHQAFWSAGTSASEDWVRGEILVLRSGFIYRIGTFDTAAQIDTDDAGFDGVYRHFIAMSDHDASDFSAASYVAVEEILDDTILEMQLASSSTDLPDMDTLNTLLATGSVEAQGVYKSAAISGATPGNVWGLDVVTATTKGVLVVQAKSTDYQWMITSGTTTGVNALVHCKLVQSVQI